MGGGDLPGYETPPDPVYGVIELVGEFFSSGLACGSAFHFVRGLRNSPRGARLAGAVRAASTHAPHVAGKLAAYFAAFSAIENGVSLARGKEDALNIVAAGATTWGFHAMRRGGALAAGRCALLGVVGVIALLEIDRAGMVWYSKKLMVNRAHPVPIGARRGNPMDIDYE